MPCISGHYGVLFLYQRYCSRPKMVLKWSWLFGIAVSEKSWCFYPDIWVGTLCVWNHRQVTIAAPLFKVMVNIMMDIAFDRISVYGSSVVGHVSCMRHLKKICGPHKHQICSRNMVQNCLKPTTASRSAGMVQTHGWCHSVGNQIEIGNRNTSDIEIAVENAILCGKICDMFTWLKYAKNAAAVCKICGSCIFA